ncbi:MAG: hypothetical protein ACLFVJ_03340 [Persicimonas sp.]
MFEFYLNYEEKEALLRLVGYLATSDQEIQDEERKFVRDLAHDLNVSAEGVFQGLDEDSITKIAARFERDSAKLVALVELIDLGMVDGEYFAEEKAAVREVAEAMGVSEDEIEPIEKWVEKGQKWHQEGRELLGLTGDQKMDV